MLEDVVRLLAGHAAKTLITLRHHDYLVRLKGGLQQPDDAFQVLHRRRNNIQQL
jgi:hypothetical protein